MRLGLFVLLAAGCVPRSVQDRLTALEVRVASLEAQRGVVPPSEPTEDPRVVLGEARTAIASGNNDRASELLASLANHPDESVRAAVEREQTNLAVVGKPAPSLAEVESWLQGDPVDLAAGAHLLVFFEAWCPHCRRELPQLEERVAEHDVGVVLLTKLSRDSTEDQVLSLLDTSSASFPTAHEDGSISEALSVRGVPAAALVEDGVVVWRGHPGRLSDATFQALLGAQ